MHTYKLIKIEHNKLKNSRTKGFGKLEVIIALMIIGVLIFLAIPIYNSLRAGDPVDDNATKASPSSTSPQWNSGSDSNGSETPVHVLPRN
jgi:type IV pilus assembly protein PilA